jgi:hypothetical protein
MTRIHYAHVDEHGKLRLDAPASFASAMRVFAGKPVELTVRVKRNRRSDRQNAYYWSVIVGMLAEFCGYDQDAMHEALKWKFLRLEADSPLPTVRSTASLSTHEFEEYVERVRLWAGADLGVNIPLPNEVSV